MNKLIGTLFIIVTILLYSISGQNQTTVKTLESIAVYHSLNDCAFWTIEGTETITPKNMIQKIEQWQEEFDFSECHKDGIVNIRYIKK